MQQSVDRHQVIDGAAIDELCSLLEEGSAHRRKRSEPKWLSVVEGSVDQAYIHRAFERALEKKGWRYSKVTKRWMRVGVNQAEEPSNRNEVINGQCAWLLAQMCATENCTTWSERYDLLLLTRGATATRAAARIQARARGRAVRNAHGDEVQSRVRTNTRASAHSRSLLDVSSREASTVLIFS